MSDENVEIVRKAFAAFQQGLRQGDPGAAYDTGLLADDAEWVTPGLMGENRSWGVRDSPSSCVRGLRASTAGTFKSND